MRIGLVLPAIPGYSETFFRSKIMGLVENGNEVILFVSGGDGAHYEGAQVIRQYRIVKNRVIQIVAMFFTLVALCFLKFSVLKKFIRLERESKRSWRVIMENIYINAHLLQQQLDWLHFGFATMGVRRENVGPAIGSKVAVSFRGYDIGLYPLNRPGCYDLLWTKIDRVHTISDDLLKKAYQLGLSREIEVVKITPAIDAERFQLARTMEDHQHLTILTIGRLHWKKGLEYTLEALAQLKRMGYSFHYTIVGEGEELERLVFAAHQLGITEQVSFLGKVLHDQIPEIMRKHQVYLQYSLQEGFCNAVLEAQASGMLCIVSDAEGLSENVLHNVTGWVVARRNVTELVKRIQNTLALSQEEKKRVTFRASNRILEDFDLINQKRKFLSFYK